MDWAIRCEQLHKTYPGRPPVEAVRGLDLHVRVGECFGLLGPNGAGKTTTIEILEGLLDPTSGIVEIFGMRWDQAGDALRQRIGVSLQETKLSDRIGVLETLTLFRSFYHQGLEPAEAMRMVALEEKRSTWVNKLSGGQKQRLAVACALVGDPDLLFLDEPTTGLDPQSRRQLWDIVRQLSRRGKTVLITTHYMDEAEKLCDRIAIVDQGKVIALGTPMELIGKLPAAHVIEFSLPPGVEAGVDPSEFEQLPGVHQADNGNGRVQLTVDAVSTALPALLAMLERRRLEIDHLATRHASLEDVFVQLTGRHLRDE